ncbi:Acyl-CoA-binding domain-containing protein 6 [Camellia lanceoleosa]|nr:Acyl-CoA-binding domain-containing protein 6 [Camellia lanceoleosa]
MVAMMDTVARDDDGDDLWQFEAIERADYRDLQIFNSRLSCRDELANEIRVEYEKFKTDVTALFLAIHTGTMTLVRKLWATVGPCKIAKPRGWSPVEQSKWTRLVKVDWAHQWIWPNSICRHVLLWTSPSKGYVEFRTPLAMGREILKEETPSIAGNYLSSSKVFYYCRT